jgi:hypothetical protein
VDETASEWVANSTGAMIATRVKINVLSDIEIARTMYEYVALWSCGVEKNFILFFVEHLPLFDS